MSKSYETEIFTVTTCIVSLDTKEDALEIVGGKGRSLAKLINAGFNVPGGFQVTTWAYQSFVAYHGLQDEIIARARPSIVDGRTSFEQASKDIQALFSNNNLADDIAAEISEAYGALDRQPAVAVRSSATAEDLPGLSFAGQQETYLNIRGADEVAAAVKNCWASLWTAQAISYRHQNGIEQDSVAMAVVVQVMVPSDVSGILFTANPATGERNEMIVNASFGLGEAVVSGQVTPDTYIVDKATLTAKETIIGPKEQQVVTDGEQGTKLADVPYSDRELSSLSEEMLKILGETAIKVEQLYAGLPQDIEWAFEDSRLLLLQSRPITNLPVQPIEVDWTPTPPAKILYRRQIVENMPDPICPLFEELYLTEGLESGRSGPSIQVGGGPGFVTCNGYAYNRADHPGNHIDPNSSEEELMAAHKAMVDEIWERYGDQSDKEQHDMTLFRSELSPEDQTAFDKVAATYNGDNLAHELTLPPSENPTYVANNKTQSNDERWQTWQDEAKPRLIGTAEKWRKLDVATASDEKLLEGIRDMGIEEGYYWTSNTSHTFGISKSNDDQLQCFLHENLPDDHYISGQFLTGFESKTLQANTILFDIAKKIRASADLSYLIIVTPSDFLLEALQKHGQGKPILNALDDYFAVYGHRGYSLDFIEPTLAEDPSATFATLKSMVQVQDYDPKNQEIRASAVREKKFAEVAEKLDGLNYWQFRYRLWFARRYNQIREETAFYFGYTWSELRPMAYELGKRMVDAGTFFDPEDTFFMITEELTKAIGARKDGNSIPELGKLAAERRQLREARKLLHPPGTIPEEASKIPSVRFKETQIRNDDSSDSLNGFAVSSGRVTALASVILSQNDFGKMAPGTILVAPNTTPAWTQLFAHAAGLVTDMGSILAHGSIVAREYGIPAVLGVGNGTVRIKHGQSITIDGDAGTVDIHEEDS